MNVFECHKQSDLHLKVASNFIYFYFICTEHFADAKAEFISFQESRVGLSVPFPIHIYFILSLR